MVSRVANKNISAPTNNNKSCFDDTDDDDDDDDDVNSVDTAELLKRIPTKPGVQVPEPYISSTTKKASSSTPPPQATNRHKQQSTNTRQSEATTSPRPKSVEAEAPKKSSPVRFELPAQFDSSSSSESEDEEDDSDDADDGKNENIEENRQKHDVVATRPPFAETNRAMQKENHPSPPQMQQVHLESARTVAAPTIQNAESNNTNFDNDMPQNHDNLEEVHFPDRQHIHKSNDDLFRDAFMGGYTDETVEQHHTEKDHNDMTDYNEQRIQQHDPGTTSTRQTAATEEELFRDAFLDGVTSQPTTNGAERYEESRMRTAAPAQLRDPRREAELFNAAFMDNSNDRKQSSEVIDLVDSDDEDANAYHHDGMGRYPSTSPAYNLKARNFLRRGNTEEYQNVAGFGDVDDHDRLENRSLRRVTDDHAHHLRHTSASEAETYQRNGKPFAGLT